MDEKTIIEINGIKMEVDLRTAKRVDTFKIGSKVKLLKNDGYSDSKHVVYPGVIVGFEEFKKLPTILVLYVHQDYSSAQMKMQYINAETQNCELILADDDFIPFEKADVLNKMDREILKKQTELEELQQRKEYFLTRFAEAFYPTTTEVDQ